MTTATLAFQAVREQGERIKCDDAQRFPEAASPGDAWRQGDVYITKLDKVPTGCVPCALVSQLAEGTTQGSRHILDSLEGVEMFQYTERDVLDGPVLRTSVERVITHPEHGDVILPPGCYHITYQRAFAEELRRVQD